MRSTLFTLAAVVRAAFITSEERAIRGTLALLVSALV